MRCRILATLICFISLLPLLVNCTQGAPQVVTVTREVLETPIAEVLVTQQPKSMAEHVAELAYEDLPMLDGTSTDVLPNSRWQLARFVIDGIDSTDHTSGKWIQFEEFTWFGFDSCNQIFGGYKANENGDFILNLHHTLVACAVIDGESGEHINLRDKEFNEALQSVVAFQIQDGQLWLFYPDDRKHALVFSPEIASEEK